MIAVRLLEITTQTLHPVGSPLSCQANLLLCSVALRPHLAAALPQHSCDVPNLPPASVVRRSSVSASFPRPWSLSSTALSCTVVAASASSDVVCSTRFSELVSRVVVDIPLPFSIGLIGQPVLPKAHNGKRDRGASSGWSETRAATASRQTSSGRRRNSTARPSTSFHVATAHAARRRAAPPDPPDETTGGGRWGHHSTRAPPSPPGRRAPDDRVRAQASRTRSRSRRACSPANGAGLEIHDDTMAPGVAFTRIWFRLPVRRRETGANMEPRERPDRGDPGHEQPEGSPVGHQR